MESNSNENQSMEMPRHNRIKLSFKAQDGTALYYRVSVHIKLRKLLVAYCKEANLWYEDVRFLYDGKRLAVDQTAAEIGMEDGDEIDVMIHQTGGGEEMNQN